MFEKAEALPPDPILGLKEIVTNDPRPDKIDLTAGVYCDESGTTPTFQAVRLAEQRLVAAGRSKSYLPIAGDADYLAAVISLLHIDPAQAAAIQTPGGTAAVYEAGLLVGRLTPDATVWMPSTTWPNHPGVFEAAGLALGRYPYEPKAGEVDVDAMCEGLRSSVRPGDAVLVHGCCHNPTGTDPDADGWARVAATLAELGIVTIADTAYLGFGVGFDEDRVGIDALVAAGLELLVCVSFSKNMGLYAERVGALVAVSSSPESNRNVLGNLKAITRSSYSNPPAWGARVAALVMHDDELRRIWLDELDSVRERIRSLRRQLDDAVAEKGVDAFAGVSQQSGMFSMSGLDRETVHALRANHGIYMLDSGRVNVAGLAAADVGRLVDAIATELAAQPA